MFIVIYTLFVLSPVTMIQVRPSFLASLTLSRNHFRENDKLYY